MTRTIHFRRTARGFSLLELMVAVAISSMLLMGVVALFVSSRASYETTEKLSRIQENGRYALDQLANDIRSAGYQGCSRPVGSGARRAGFNLNTIEPRLRPSAVWDFTAPIEGFQGTGASTFAPNLATALNPVALPSPAPRGIADVLVLRIPRRDTAPMILAAKQANASAALVVEIPDPLQQTGPAVITDCLARTYFQITRFNGNQVFHEQSQNFNDAGQRTASLRHVYLKGAEIVPLTTVMYYLAPRDQQAAQAVPMRLSLYRREGTNATEEIAEGIDRMEIRYGVDTTSDGRVDNYVDANAVANWNAVYSVQISLLARAPEAYGTELDNQQYTLLMAGSNGVAAVTAGPFADRFQRKVFTATAALRNQIID